MRYKVFLDTNVLLSGIDVVTVMTAKEFLDKIRKK